MKKNATLSYTLLEEKLNVYSHLFGLIFSIIGLGLLIYKAYTLDNTLTTISLLIFGLSMITLYSASTLYHAATNPRKRYRLKIFDHVSIFLLIAGTYTPFTLITLNKDHGFLIFCIVWGFAFVGIFLKLYYTGRFKILSTLMYVFMGWMIVFTFTDLEANLSAKGIDWLIAGGISYTVGAVIYSINKIPFNHAIFHVFVLAGTFCHFISIYEYVI